MLPSLEIARPRSDTATQTLVITGMHRSGTSLVSNILQLAGVHVGERLISANVANPRGYFEDVEFYEFHESLLHRQGTSYLHAEANGTFVPTGEEVEQARQLIASRAAHRVWGWKDPRTSLFLDFWHDLLPDAKYLFVYRHPLDVMLSLLRRGEFDNHPSLSAGLKAWHVYNGKIEAFYKDHASDCALVHIDGLVDNFSRFSELVEQKLELEFPREQEAFEQVFHAGELRNTPLAPEAAEVLDRLFPDSMALYDRLNVLADMPPGERAASESTPSLSLLARFVAAETEPAGDATKEAVLLAVASLLMPERADAMLQRFNQSGKGLQQKVDQIWLYAQKLERDCNELGATIKSYQTQFDTQESLIASAHLRLSASQIHVQEQNHVLSGQAAEIGSLMEELRRAQRSWIRKLLRLPARANKKVKVRSPSSRKETPMSTQVYHGGMPSQIEGTMAERIAQVRQMQDELRARPVTGSMRRFKKLFFQVIRSTFSRQFTLNAATVDLIESLHRELERQTPQLLAQSSQLQSQARQMAPPASVNGATNGTSYGAAIASGEVLASCGMTQDQAKLNNIRPLHGFNHVYTSPAEMRMPERVALYGLIFGLQPRNCLEVGTFRGGSSAIISGAMEDTGFGQLACVDPSPKVDPALWSQICSRCRMFEGPSPDILPEVRKQVGADFDFALIDANHTYDFVKRDIAGVLPLMADSSYLLFHDGHYPDVKKAIDEAVVTYPDLTDCGLLSVEPTVLHENGQSTTWAGLRLLRFQRSTAR